MAENNGCSWPDGQSCLPEGFSPEYIELIWPVQVNANGSLTMAPGVTLGDTERERSPEAMSELARAFAALLDDFPTGLQIEARAVIANPHGFTHSLRVSGESWRGPSDWLARLVAPSEEDPTAS
jgi:hypothetical protein